jgi:hypothetical protein
MELQAVKKTLHNSNMGRKNLIALPFPSGRPRTARGAADVYHALLYPQDGG